MPKVFCLLEDTNNDSSKPGGELIQKSHPHTFSFLKESFYAISLSDMLREDVTLEDTNCHSRGTKDVPL